MNTTTNNNTQAENHDELMRIALEEHDADTSELVWITEERRRQADRRRAKAAQKRTDAIVAEVFDVIGHLTMDELREMVAARKAA